MYIHIKYIYKLKMCICTYSYTHIHCHLLLKLPTYLRVLIWLVVCRLPNSHDKAVLTGVPWAVLCSSVGCLQFDIKWEQGSRWAELQSDLTGPQIRSAVVPSGCGTALKLRAALICFIVCTVEAVLGLLGNYLYVPQPSKVDISFLEIVIFGFV